MQNLNFFIAMINAGVINSLIQKSGPSGRTWLACPIVMQLIFYLAKAGSSKLWDFMATTQNRISQNYKL